jgi:hypothetical protein
MLPCEISVESFTQADVFEALLVAGGSAVVIEMSCAPSTVHLILSRVDVRPISTPHPTSSDDKITLYAAISSGRRGYVVGGRDD